MARKLRIQYPGAIYHVMNRGDRREAIFEDDQNRERLLETLTEACEKTGWQVHAYCLMGNHFHLVLETPRPNLVVRMRRCWAPIPSLYFSSARSGLTRATSRPSMKIFSAKVRHQTVKPPVLFCHPYSRGTVCCSPGGSYPPKRYYGLVILDR